MAEERVRVVIEGDSGDLVAACRQAVVGIRGVTSASLGASRGGAALGAMGRKQADTLRSWGHAAYYAAGGVTAITAGLAGHAVVEGLKFNAAFQDAETSFKTFLGTAERAQAFVEKLRNEVANVSPFRLTEFMDASKQLMGFGMGAEEVVDTLKAVNAAVIASGGNVEILDRVVLSLGQVKATGKLSGDEMRQLAEAGIPVQKILQKELGLTGEQVANIGKQGISAQRGLDAIRKGLTEKYGAAAKNAADNFSLQVSRLRKDSEQIERLATEPLFDYLNKRVLPEALRASHGVTEIFKRTDLDLGDKLRLSRDEVRRDLGPVLDELRQAVGEAHVDDWLEERFKEALPKIASAAGHLGVRAAGAFAHAFVNSDLLGRAVLGGWLLSKAGVFAYWKTYGLRAGQAAGAGAATGMAGGLRGKIPGLLRGVSIALPVAAILGPSLVEAISGPSKDKLKGQAAEILKAAFQGAQAGLGGIKMFDSDLGLRKSGIAGDIGEIQKALEGSAKSGDKFAAVNVALLEVERGSGSAITAARNVDRLSTALRSLADTEGGKAGRVARDMADQLDAAVAPLGRVRQAFETTSRLGAADIHNLRVQLGTNMRAIRMSLDVNSDQGKAAVAENFALIRGAIQRNIDAGVISTREGMAEIRRLMRSELKALGFSDKQIGRYDDDRDPLTGKRPTTGGPGPGAQRGLQTLGDRNQAGRDSIPILAAAGEDVAVFTRHQRQAVDAALAEKYGVDLRGLFGAIRQDHAMPLASNPLLRGFARGGWVTGDTDYGKALASRLNRMAAETKHRISVQSGGRSVAEQMQLKARYGGSRPVAGPNGPHVRGVAADITPGREVFGGVAGKYGLGFTVPSESWHIQLLDAAAGAVAGASAHAEKLKRVRVRNDLGMISSVGQRSVDLARAGAQKILDRAAAHSSSGGDGTGPTGDVSGITGSVNDVVERVARERGWSAADWKWIIGHESGGKAVYNKSGSGAFGVGQLMPFNYARYGGAPGSSLAEQTAAMGEYIADRYGNPTKAKAYWEGHNSYQRGGLVDAIRAQAGFAPAATSAGKKRPPKKVKHKPSKKLGLKKLRAVLPLDEIKQLARLDGVFEQADAGYGRVEREQGLTDETLTVTPPGGTTEVRNEPDIARRSGELGVLIGLRSDIRGLLAQQSGILAAAAKTVGAGILERIARIKEIKKKVAANVERLKALKRELDSKPADSRKKAIKTEMGRLRDQNRALAGEADKLGDGGELGKTRKGLTSWRDQKDALDVRAKDLPGKLEDERLNIAELWKEKALVEGTTVPAGVTSGGGDSVLSDLVKQQLAESQEALRISRTEMGVFARFLPLFGGRLVGAFAHGGRIPETGVALVHRDEMITPDPQGPYGRQIPAAGGPVVGAAPQITLVFDSNSGELVRLVDARIDGQATKVVTEQAGRRTRMLVDAPGG